MRQLDGVDTSSNHLRREAGIQSAIHLGVWAAICWFAFSGSLLAKGMRFGIVGATSGFVFACTTFLLISEGRVDERLSSIIGYIVSMPVNFFANRSFSFRSKGNLRSDAIRYTVLQVVNMAVSAGAMQAATNTLGLHYLFGIVGAIVLVPLTNFLLMEIWVFGRSVRQKAGSSPTPRKFLGKSS